MAWISDLAGKAESLLNKLDSEAASVLTAEKQAKLFKSLANSSKSQGTSDDYVSTGYGSTSSLPSSSSVPGSLHSYFGSLSSSRGSPKSTNKAIKSAQSVRATSASASVSPSHSRNASLENYLSFGVGQGGKNGLAWSAGDDPAYHTEKHSSPSQQSSLSSSPSLPTSKSAEPSQPFTAINLESSASSSVSSAGSGVSAQLDTYVKVDHTDLEAVNSSRAKTLAESSETDLLKREVVNLNQEIQQLVSKSSATQAELQACRASQSSATAELSAAQKQLRELQQRELSLQEEVGAREKAASAAELRLAQAEQQLQLKDKELAQCRLDNTRLCEGASVSSERHSSTLQAASAELVAAEAALRLEQQQRRADQQSFSDRLQILEDEREALAAQAKAASDKLQQLQQAQLDHQAQVSGARAEATAAREELESYKNKARHILASKEALIDALKHGTPGAAADPRQAQHTSLLEVELKQARAELSLSREELAKNAEQQSRLRAELSELERCAEQESARHAAALSDAQEQLAQLTKLKDDLELENRHARQEARCLQEELSRAKVQHSTLLQEAVSERDALSKQLQHAARPGSGREGGGEQEGLQRRLQGVTEALLQRQSELDCLNSQLQARDRQLARLQQQQQEPHLLGRDHAPVSVPMEDVRSRGGVPALLVETPFDGGVARRVKRAYTSVDRLSVSLGLFLRRHPAARIVVLLYVLLLHLWVLLVLLTYTPEVHDHAYQPPAAAAGVGGQHPPLPHT